MRSFFAINLEPHTKYDLENIIEQLKETQPNVKWVKTENSHLTLAFLGDIEDNKANNLTSAVMDSLPQLQIEPFKLHLSKIGAFPNMKHPRVIWVGPEENEGSKKVCMIYEHLKKQLELFDFNLEKRFTPHITLGRVRSRKNIEKTLKKASNITVSSEVNVKGFSLMNSELFKEGPRYTERAYFKLR